MSPNAPVPIEALSERMRVMHQSELCELIRFFLEQPANDLFRAADYCRRQHYASSVFVRALIEFSNYCRQDCLYCGLRRGNASVRRYRLNETDILGCCEQGFALGFRSFVLQSGEDPYWNDERLCALLRAIRERFGGCAITLSVGERTKESYARLKAAGAERFLLRHETADPAHFERLHPAPQTFNSRRNCLFSLKELGYQVGAGFMVASPFQTEWQLAADLLFLRELQPQMVGIGPFIPQKDSPFAQHPAGSLHATRVMLALTRLLLPRVLLPATTALASLHPQGRTLGLQAGANVVMPNLSPGEHRKDYALYDHKAALGAESAEGLSQLVAEIEEAGYKADFSRGDSLIPCPSQAAIEPLQ